MYYASSLSETQATHVAEAYFRSGKNPRKMAEALGHASFDLELIRHPLVKRKITQLASNMRKMYSLDDHLEKLQEIRDLALDEGNFRIALAAELSVGKAAGLYEKVAETVESTGVDPTKLTSEDIKRQLAAMGAQNLLDDHSGESLVDLPGDDEI